MAVRFRLIVGLGNPTAKYEKTRHNAGFWFLDELVARLHVPFGLDGRTHGLLAAMETEGERVFFLKPMQYMNRSGEAVSALAHYFKIEPERILVAHDELDFAPGVVRLKLGGGHGGHNGLRDITSRLGSSGFARIRLGIGHPGDRQQVVSYVLDCPPKREAELVREAIVRAVDLFPALMEGKLEAVMSSLHVAAN